MNRTRTNPENSAKLTGLHCPGWVSSLSSFGHSIASKIKSLLVRFIETIKGLFVNHRKNLNRLIVAVKSLGSDRPASDDKAKIISQSMLDEFKNLENKLPLAMSATASDGYELNKSKIEDGANAIDKFNEKIKPDEANLNTVKPEDWLKTAFNLLDEKDINNCKVQINLAEKIYKDAKNAANKDDSEANRDAADAAKKQVELMNAQSKLYTKLSKTKIRLVGQIERAVAAYVKAAKAQAKKKNS